MIKSIPKQIEWIDISQIVHDFTIWGAPKTKKKAG